jgi:hypothetical protein
MTNFSAISWREQVVINENEMIMMSDFTRPKYAEFDFYNATL